MARLKVDDPRLALRARALISLIDSGDVSGVELLLLPSYRDLTDCRKVYFGLTGQSTTHRIVYQVTPRAGIETIEIVEMVAVESRREGYVYLLAAQRLSRLPAESAAKLKRVHHQEIERRSRAPRTR